MRKQRYAIPSAHAVGSRVVEGVVDKNMPSEYAMRDCPRCGRQHLLKEEELCPWCSGPSPFASPLAILVDAGGEDSPHPERVADGSAGYNAGLPPIQNPDGTWRPVSNAELGNNRGVREYAKRHGLEPMTRGRFRGI